MIKHKLFLLPVFVLVFSMVTQDVAFAATSLAQAGLRFGRLGISASTGNDLFVSFKVTTATGVNKVKVCLPSGYTTTAGTPAVSAPPSGYTSPTGLPATATTAAGAGGCLGGTVLVSGLSGIATATQYGFVVAAGNITNPATAGQYTPSVETQNSGGTQIDTTTVATYIYGGGGGSTSNADQVTVNASVAPNFTFQLSGNSDTIPAADASGPKTSTGVTMTVSTNAPLGYTGYVRSANAGLVSASASATIASGTFDGTPDALTPAGTIEKYLFVPTSGTICVTACTGSIAYDGEYNGLTAGGAGTTGGAFNSTNYSSFVSRTGVTGGDNFVLQERVGVKSTTKYATDYTDTLTIVAAGNF